ncbi:transcription initiation factor IIB family protein [Haloarcula sp. 1CSR25-25]|uniref:transcription initiation factor IIB n=1 Tax=Haloarcula sp. 1CSR25-25 TaxID=2862545 RepID=UPI0028955E12|nr:transcription initiation factor IIB family protein [Haloarcula sp. 1CSR25-25]MDT3434671.1 transcription initiation factor IIB family protein [Haloarcula sp. 1CSR25-25]
MQHTTTLTESSDTTDETAPDVAHNQCPECGGHLVTDEQHGEQSCSDCGLVVTTDQLDRGPDWYTSEGDGGRRSGAPITSRFVDKGLSTRMGHGDFEAATEATSERRRRQLHRLRRRQQWCRGSAEPAAQRDALAEVRRIATSLGLRGDVREAATTLLSRVYDEGFFLGRTVEGVAAAVVYATARIFEVPRRFAAVVVVARTDEAELRGTYLSMVRACDLKVPPPRPLLYLPALASDLGLTHETRRHARALLEAIDGVPELTGRNPVGVAAMAIYVASCVTAEQITQTEIADEAGVSTVTIRVTRARVGEIVGKAPTAIITEAVAADDSGTREAS